MIGWVRSVETARNTTGPGLVALSHTLLDDVSTPPALRELARRFLEAGLYREDRPRARATDPGTSQDAARSLVGVSRPGGVIHRLLMLYGAVAGLRDGMTSLEAGQEIGVPTAHKRTSELLRDGLLEIVRVYDGDGGGPDEGNMIDLVRDGGRVLRITDAGREELARLDVKAAARA